MRTVLTILSRGNLKSIIGKATGLAMLLGIAIFSSSSYAKCNIPEGATVERLRMKADDLLFNLPEALLRNASEYNILEGQIVKAWQPAEGGFRKVCFEGSTNGSPLEVEGYIHSSSLEVVSSEPATENATEEPPRGGSRCAGVDRNESDVAGRPIVELDIQLELRDYSNFACGDLLPLAQGAKLYYLREGKDASGNKYARVTVHSPTKGWIEGWVPMDKVTFRTSSQTEAGVCPGGYCGDESRRARNEGLFGAFSDIRDAMIPANIPTGFQCSPYDKDQFRCAVCLCYFEARSESLEGQTAAVKTAMKRAKTPRRWSNNVCGVSSQNHNHRYPQFTFWQLSGSQLKMRTRSGIQSCVQATNKAMKTETPWPYDHYLNPDTVMRREGRFPKWWRKGCNGYNSRDPACLRLNSRRWFKNRSGWINRCMRLCQPGEISSNCIKQIDRHFFCVGP